MQTFENNFKPVEADWTSRSLEKSSFEEDLVEKGELRSARSATLHLPKAIKSEMWSTDWTLLQKLVLCKVWGLLEGSCKHSWSDGKNRMKASEPERSSKDQNVPAFWQCSEFSMKTPHQRSMITCLKTDNFKRALDAAGIHALLREEMHIKEIYMNLTSTRAWSNVSVGHLMWAFLKVLPPSPDACNKTSHKK